MTTHGFLNKLLSVGLCCLLLVMPVLTTGCSSAQVVADIQDITAKLPQIAQLATGVVSLVDPAVAPLIQPAAALIATDGKTLVDLIQQYQAAPNATLLQKINAAVQDGIANTSQLAAAVGVKNGTSYGRVQACAGLLGLIFSDLADFVSKNAPPATISQLPAFFGWHIAGVDLIAIDGKKIPSPAPGKTKPSGYSARDLGVHWNKLCKAQGHPEAQIDTPRRHVLGIPLPFSGHKASSH